MQTTQIKRVSVREFNKNLCSLLNELPIMLTKHNKPIALIVSPNVTTISEDEKVTTKNVTTIRNPIDIKKEVIERSKKKLSVLDCVGMEGIGKISMPVSTVVYGCGCKRTDTRLCQKHQRL